MADAFLRAIFCISRFMNRNNSGVEQTANSSLIHNMYLHIRQMKNVLFSIRSSVTALPNAFK